MRADNIISEFLFFHFPSVVNIKLSHAGDFSTRITFSEKFACDPCSPGKYAGRIYRLIGRIHNIALEFCDATRNPTTTPFARQ